MVKSSIDVQDSDESFKTGERKYLWKVWNAQSQNSIEAKEGSNLIF